MTHRAPNPCQCLVFVLGLLLVPLAGLAATPAVPKRVLIVHSFGTATPPFTTESTAFETELKERLGGRVDLSEVSLDMARNTDHDMQEALVEYLRNREAHWRPDLVVPIGSPAADFVAQYRDRLFREIPVLYAGLDQRRLPPGTLQKSAAFVGLDVNLRGFVEDILQVAPATTNIVMVTGASPLEQSWKAVFQREFQPFAGRVGFTWLDNLPFDEMLERVGKLPPHSYIFLVMLLRDASGVTHNTDESLKRIHDAANAPVNGVFQNQLGLGIVGGRLYQAELEGEEAAGLAIRILQGEPASSFAPIIVPPLAPRYDWRELRRWRISEAQLPPGSVVLFRAPTAWQQYRAWYIAGISACLVETLLVFVLLANLLKRRRAERSLAEGENRLRAILDATGDAIIMMNDRGVIESVNHAAEKIFGYSAPEMVGENMNMLLPQSLSLEHDRYLAEIQRLGTPRIFGRGREISGRRKNGAVFPIDLEVREISLPDRRVYGGFVRDITERKAAERTAREFGGRLIKAQEEDRSRLARELHDDITQRLARLAIDAGRAEGDSRKMGRGEIWQDVREGLVRLSEDVHSLSYKLHPSLLRDLGLAAALQAECERFSRQEPVAVEASLAEIPEGIPPETGLCLFRVAQEALRNVARHSRAPTVKIWLRPLDGGLQLAVTDTGSGFDPRLQRQRPSLGLASMRERVRLIDGELDVESAPGRGTSIVAWVPLTGGKA